MAPGILVRGFLYGLLLYTCTEARYVARIPHHRPTRSVNGTQINDDGGSSDAGRIAGLAVVFVLLLVAFGVIATLTYCYFRRGKQHVKEARRKALMMGHHGYINRAGPSDEGFSNDLCDEKSNGKGADPFCVVRAPLTATNNNNNRHSGKYKQLKNGESGDGKRHSVANGYSARNQLSPVQEDHPDGKPGGAVSQPSTPAQSLRTNRRQSAPASSSMAKLARESKQQEAQSADVSGKDKDKEYNIPPGGKPRSQPRNRLPPLENTKDPTNVKRSKREARRNRKYSEQLEIEHNPNILKVHQSDPDIRKSVELEEQSTRRQRRHSVDILHLGGEDLPTSAGPCPIEGSGEDTLDAALASLGMDSLRVGKNNEPISDSEAKHKKINLKNRRSSAPGGELVKQKLNRNPSGAKERPASGNRRLRKELSLDTGQATIERNTSNRTKKDRPIESELEASKGDRRRHHRRRRHHGDRKILDDEERRKRRENMTEEEKQKYRERRRRHMERRKKQKEEEANLTEAEREDLRRRRRHRRHRRRHQEVRKSLEGNSIVEEPEEDAKSHDSDVDMGDNANTPGSDEGDTSAWETSASSDSDNTGGSTTDQQDTNTGGGQSQQSGSTTHSSPARTVQNKLPDVTPLHQDLKSPRRHSETNVNRKDNDEKGASLKMTPRRHSEFEARPSSAKLSEAAPQKTVSSKFIKGKPEGNAWNTNKKNSMVSDNFTYVTDNFESVDLAPYLGPAFEYDA